MIKLTDFSSSDGHTYMKCKTCKQEFYVVSAAKYIKTVCFCPYCGDSSQPKRHKNKKLNTMLSETNE